MVSEMKSEYMLSKMESKFLNESNLKKDYKNTSEKALGKTRKYRRDKDKELFYFTPEEIREIMTSSLSNLSEGSIKSYISVFNKYFDWIKENGYYKFTYNYRTLIEDIREELINNTKFIILSRKEVYEFANSIESAQDGIIIALVFEGVKGEKNSKYSEIMNIKHEDLFKTTLKTESRRIELPKDIIPIYKNACNQKTRKVLNDKIAILNEDGYLIKEIVGKKSFKNRRDSWLITTKLGKYIINDQKVDGNILRLSGECFYLSIIEKLKGELTDDDYSKVIDRYKGGKTVTSITKLKDSYIKYKNSMKYEVADTELYYDIYSQILREDEQKNMNSRVDKEIGEIGEKFFYERLVECYGKPNVLDETKNGVGYDFSVINKVPKLMYEVKSTKKEGNIILFYMTIKEMKMAAMFNREYKLSILFFNDKKLVSSYIIPDPINNLGIEKQTKSILNLESEGICIPLEIKVTISINKIKKFKINI